MVITMFVAVVTIAGSAVAADTAGALGVAIAMACGIALQNVLTFASPGCDSGSGNLPRSLPSRLAQVGRRHTGNLDTLAQPFERASARGSEGSLAARLRPLRIAVIANMVDPTGSRC